MKSVLITGASGAIGRAIALAYGQKGYNIALNYNQSRQKALELKNTLREEYGIEALAIQADISCPRQANRLAEQALENFGFIDILINNAGIAQQKLFTQITDEEWQKMLSVNLGGVFNCCRAVLPSMLTRHQGSILNISSMWGQIGASCEVHYSTTKAGIIGLTKALAKEVAPSNITVNCIAPGVIETPMLNQLTKSDLKALEEETPLRRLGTPKDIADTAVFLTGSESLFITGQVLGVNGGFVI